MVARKGSAPPTSGCRPDVILFHHRAKTGCRGWNRTSIRAFKGRCPTIRRPGNELVEPEVVATSPYRIKSPVPVCCGFDSVNWWAREDLHLQGSQTLDLWGLLFPLNHSPENWSPRTSVEFRMQNVQNALAIRSILHFAFSILH